MVVGWLAEKVLGMMGLFCVCVSVSLRYFLQDGGGWIGSSRIGGLEGDGGYCRHCGLGLVRWNGC